MLPEFTPLDRRIRHYELVLERSLENLPEVDLPEGYHFATYQDGDRDIWIEIESSAGEFENYEYGLTDWNRYYLGNEYMLPERMFFVEDANGQKLATATAFYDDRDPEGAGWLHWVSVRKEAQGKGLSKPLILKALKRLQELGYTKAKIPTQTTSWLACKVYLDLGFHPIPANAFHSHDGWRIVKRLTNHDSLWMFDPAPDELVLADGVPDPGRVVEDNLLRKEEGKPYRYDDPRLLSDQHSFQDAMYAYNRIPAVDIAARQEKLKEIFAEIGDGCTVETPVHANWGCRHVHVGKGTYINSNVTFVDDEQIYIGDYCLIAPNVVFSTSGHPVLPILREHHYVYNLPIHVGRNVWIGSGAQIMPGITIGDNSVIGAGSVVTHDIPADVVAMGVPCQVVRPIGEKDRRYYYKDRELDVWL